MWKSVKYPSNRDSSRKLQSVSQGVHLGDREELDSGRTAVRDINHSCSNAAITRGKEVQTQKTKPIKMVTVLHGISTGRGFKNWTSTSWWSPPLRN